MRKDEAKRMIEFLATGKRFGDFVAVKASDWVSGKGSYTSKRALPPLAKEIEVAKIEINIHRGGVQRGTAEYAALRYFGTNHRVKKVIVMSISEAKESLIG